TDKSQVLRDSAIVGVGSWYGSRHRVMDLSQGLRVKTGKRANSERTKDKRQASTRASNQGQVNSSSSFPEPQAAQVMCKRHIEAKALKWAEQHEALQAPAYRLTLMHSEKPSFNLGKNKGPNNTEKFYTAEEVKEKLEFLSAKNAQGYNVFITPVDSEYHYNVVDDMTKNKAKELLREYKPCLLQESSPNNYQAILKTPKLANSKDEQLAANNFVRKINKEIGDPRFTGVVHPFRLAGFANQKKKHKNKKGQFPFTKIHHTEPGICKTASNKIQFERDNIIRHEKIKAGQEAIQRKALIDHAKTPLFNNDVDKSFKYQYNKIEKLAESKGWVKDGSAIDFKVSVELLKYYDKKEVEQAIINNSPAIAERHSNFADYAERTVDKAQERIEQIKEYEHQAKLNRGPQLER
ncbi:MAG: DNA-primase RepB domain-containing protein, partial [Bacillota bacterium]